MMAGFWFSLLVLTGVAMLFVALPLWRFRSSSSEASVELRRRANREAFEQRLREIEVEVQEGLIAAEDVERVRTELQRGFLRDMEALDLEQAAVGRMGGKALPLAFVLLVPVLSFGIYLEWGAAQDLELPALMERIGAAQDAESQTAMLAELAVVLQQRFQREQDDLQNGYMLGTLYESLQRYDEAMAVFSAMLAQMEAGPDKATVQGQLARTQYQLADGKLTPEVQQSIDAALAMNPNEYYAMSILANDAFLREDLPAALGYWRRQLSAATPGSQEAQQLRQVITLVEQSLALAGTPAAEPAAAAAGSPESCRAGVPLYDHARQLDVDDGHDAGVGAEPHRRCAPVGQRYCHRPERRPADGVRSLRAGRAGRSAATDHRRTRALKRAPGRGT